MNLLEAKNISVNINNKTLVDNISLSVKDNDWLMICGPNGAGKTTIIRALSNIVEFSGSIEVDGKDISTYRPANLAKKIAVLWQNNYVEYAYQVRQIISMGRFCHKKNIVSSSDKNDKDVIDNIIELTHLTELQNRNIKTLSGGELQRVFLAQTLVQEPKILILDEPTNHLDIKYQKIIFDIVNKWLSQGSRAVISAMHDLTIAKKYGTKAMLISQGKLVASGKIDTVITQKNINEAYSADVYNYLQDLYKNF